MKLWLVRHAEVDLPAGICYGQSDVPARMDATRRAAARLARELPHGATLRVSTLQRCELLAQELRALRPDLSLKPDASLREMDFGAWEGRAWDAIGQSAIDAWVADLATHAPGGGEHLGAMLQRVASALQDAQQTPAADVVWITHAGVARCVAWLQQQGAAALPRAADWPVAAPDFGAWETRSLIRVCIQSVN